MAVAKKAAVSLKDLGAKGSGQTFAEREQAGRKEHSLWLDNAVDAKLQELVRKLGKKYPVEVVTQLINEAYAKTGGV